MPYAFDKILETLGQPGSESGQSDIFAPAEGTGQGIAQPNGTQQLSSSEGSLGPAGGSSSSPGGQQATNSIPANNKVIQRNKDRVKSPLDVGSLTSKIGGANQALQNEANSYVQNADDRYDQSNADTGRADQEAIASFTGKAQGAKPTTDEWQNLYKNGPGRVGDFAPTTDTSFQDANLLGNDAGLRELFRRSGDAEYNVGESALDTALLSRNADFNRSREEALRAQGGLRKTEGDVKNTSRGKAQELMDSSYGKWKGGVDDTLNAAIESYRQKALAGETEFDTALGKASGAAGKGGGRQAVVNSETERLKELYPDLSGYIENPADTNSYFSGNMDGDDTNWQDFVGVDEAQNWNSILSLMGRGGDIPQAGKYAGQSGGDAYQDKFNANALQKEILPKAQKAKADYDTRYPGTGYDPVSIVDIKGDKATQAAIASETAQKQKDAETQKIFNKAMADSDRREKIQSGDWSNEKEDQYISNYGGDRHPSYNKPTQTSVNYNPKKKPEPVNKKPKKTDSVVSGAKGAMSAGGRF